MPPKLVLTLNPKEMGGLNALAEDQLRTARDQLRHILRQALQEHGLLTDELQPLHTTNLVIEEADHAADKHQ